MTSPDIPTTYIPVSDRGWEGSILFCIRPSHHHLAFSVRSKILSFQPSPWILLHDLLSFSFFKSIDLLFLPPPPQTLLNPEGKTEMLHVFLIYLQLSVPRHSNSMFALPSSSKRALLVLGGCLLPPPPPPTPKECGLLYAPNAENHTQN